MIKTFDELPLVGRVLLIIFLGWIICPIYRILKYLDTKNTVTLVVGLVCLFTGIGNIILEIVDLVTTVLGKGITVLAE